MAITANSEDCVFRHKRSRAGISLPQGVHHVAQKFTRMTFPLYPERRTVRPSRSGKRKSTAGAPLAAKNVPSCAHASAGVASHKQKTITIGRIISAIAAKLANQE